MSVLRIMHVAPARSRSTEPAPDTNTLQIAPTLPRALSRVALLPGGRAACSPRLAEPQPRRIDATRGQRRCPKVSGGRRGAAGWPPSRRTRPFSLVGWATGSPLRRRGGQRVPPRCCSSNLRAGWAAGTLHVPPRPGTTGTQRQHATWAAALLGRLPRLPSLGGGRRPRPMAGASARMDDRSRTARSKMRLAGP